MMSLEEFGGSPLIPSWCWSIMLMTREPRVATSSIHDLRPSGGMWGIVALDRLQYYWRRSGGMTRTVDFIFLPFFILAGRRDLISISPVNWMAPEGPLIF